MLGKPHFPGKNALHMPAHPFSGQGVQMDPQEVLGRS